MVKRTAEDSAEAKCRAGPREAGASAGSSVARLSTSYHTYTRHLMCTYSGANLLAWSNSRSHRQREPPQGQSTRTACQRGVEHRLVCRVSVGAQLRRVSTEGRKGGSEIGSPKRRPDSASQSSELEEHRCHRRLSMRRSRLGYGLRRIRAPDLRPIPSSVRSKSATFVGRPPAHRAYPKLVAFRLRRQSWAHIF